MKKLVLAATLAASMLVGCATVQAPSKPAPTEPMMILVSPNGPGYVALTTRDESPCKEFGAKVAFVKFNDGQTTPGCYFNDGTTVELYVPQTDVTYLPYDKFQYIEVPLQ